MGTWVIRVGDQTNGSAHHLMLPHPSQGSQYLPGGGPAGPSSLLWPHAGLAGAQWRPLGRFSGVCPRPLGRRLVCCSLVLGTLDWMNPGRGGESPAILPPGFCAPLLGGRRPKEFHQSVAQLCVRGPVTSSLWASASSLMNRPDWHLFLGVVKGMSPYNLGLALRASTS